MQELLERAKTLLGNPDHCPMRAIYEGSAIEMDMERKTITPARFVELVGEHGGNVSGLAWYASRDLNEGEVLGEACIEDSDRPVVDLYRDICTAVADPKLATPWLITRIGTLLKYGNTFNCDPVLYDAVFESAFWGNDDGYEFDNFLDDCKTPDEFFEREFGHWEYLEPGGESIWHGTGEFVRDVIDEHGKNLIRLYADICTFLEAPHEQSVNKSAAPESTVVATISASAEEAN